MRRSRYCFRTLLPEDNVVLIVFGIVFSFSLHGMAHIDVENYAHADHVRQYVRASVGDERQRYARHGHEADRHAYILENVGYQHAGHAHGEQHAEIIP